MLNAKVGDAAPAIALTCVSAQESDAQSVVSSDYAGRWLMLLFYARDLRLSVPRNSPRSAHVTPISANVIAASWQSAPILKLRSSDVSLQLELHIDEVCRGLLTAMLARDPADRPTMNEVVQMLTKGSMKGNHHGAL